METGESIRQGLLIGLKSLVIFAILELYLTQSTSAVSTNPVQPNWDDCIQEEFSSGLCNPGESKNHPLSSCSQRRPCCPCSEGYFLDGYNNCSQCKPWRDCKAEGKEVLFKGNTSHNARCGDDIPLTIGVGPGTTTNKPPITEGADASTKPQQTKDKPFVVSTTSSPPGNDPSEGTTVIKFDGGTIILILCTVLVVSLFVILLFVRYPDIPERLNRMLCHIWCRSKKKPQTNRDAIINIQMKDRVGGGKVTEV